ncbi:hypothetical protein ACTS9T_00790 [Empedobacter falsenii]|uniref:hypothetical protein n=1 Tax=Empedobacter sp. GD03797 TaxID=2975382 RepID=UPI00244A1346|nr:hypothetical protein [Empedobacter sp. GD03797]MDH1884075.1 hypothetical protein [Empedobacter sp. GD03797]
MMKLLFLLSVFTPTFLLAQLPDMISKSKIIVNKKIEANKVQVFLIYINDYSTSSCVLSEEEELRRNFDSSDFTISNICVNSDLEFPKETIKLRSQKQGIIFWSGNVNEKPIVKEGNLQNATEFVAKQLGVQKESTYVSNTKKWKAEIDELTKTNIPTKVSKEVNGAIINTLVYDNLRADKTISLNRIFSEADFSKLKTIEMTFLDNENQKINLNKITFDEKGFPTMIKKRNSDDLIILTFDNQLLKSTLENEQLTIYTHKENQVMGLIQQKDFKKLLVYRLENQNLLEDVYWINTDLDKEKNNYYDQKKMVNNCIVSYSKDYTSSECETAPGIFPYESNKEIQSSNSTLKLNIKIEDIGNGVLEVFKSIANKDFEKVGEIQLNERKLIKSYTILSNGKSVKVDYNYTYYK